MSRNLQILALVTVVSNVVFTIACIPPGCGEEERPAAPEAVVVEPLEPAFFAADDEPFTCADEVPALDLAYGGEPVPAEMWLEYRGTVAGCSGEGSAIGIGVSPAGLVPGAVEVGWTLTVDGNRTEGTTTWDLQCGAEGDLDAGHLSIGLPTDADGADVTLEVVLTDAAGTRVSASSTFVAHVTDES